MLHPSLLLNTVPESVGMPQAEQRGGKVNSAHSSQRTGKHLNFHKLEYGHFTDLPPPLPWASTEEKVTSK